MKIRICNICSLKKFIIQFPWHNRKLGIRGNACRSCHNERRRSYREQNRRYQLWHLYRLTLEEYDLMYKEQQGLCKICRKPVPVLSVDHNHTTKVVRGLLCKSCNFVVGLFENKSELVGDIQNYLGIVLTR